MTSTALATQELDKADIVIRQMADALASLPMSDQEEAKDVRRDAAIIEAASKQAKARDVEIAAARLRLHAERRLGQLIMQEEIVRKSSRIKDEDLAAWVGFTMTEVRDFKRLAMIPLSYYDRTEKTHVDLFTRAVESQLEDKSHTPYSVWMASLRWSAKRHPDHRWLWKLWDESWEILYTDPRSNRIRRVRFEGSVEEAEVAYARFSGRISASSTALLPVRGVDPLAQVLDNVRLARTCLDKRWASLMPDQKVILDGCYGVLDDLARKVAKAINM